MIATRCNLKSPPNHCQTPWLNQDVGAVGALGSSTYSSGVFTLKGAGQGIYSTADGFQYAYQALSGDGAITARVSNIQGGSNVQAGVMIRQDLNANSPNAFIYFQPNTATMYSRSTPGGSTAYQGIGFSEPAYPYWAQLVRGGNTFISYISVDGVYWIEIGTQTITMPEDAFIGLAVSSDALGTLSTVTFDNVSVSSTTSPAPTISSLSATTGSVGSQVVIYGTGFGSTQGASLVYLNGATVTVNSWTASAITITIPTGATSGLLGVSVAPSMNNSNTVVFTVTAHPLATSWLDLDIGNYGLKGTATYSNGTFTVNAAGQGVQGTLDGLHFVYQSLAGNGTIVARVANFTGGSASSQMGVMIRETLDPGATDAFVYFSPNSAEFNTRVTTGGTTSQQSASFIGPSVPYWVMLTRAGNVFTSYVSADGNYWTEVGSQTITMVQNVFIGLAVSNESTTSLVTGSFDSVAVSTDLLVPPAIKFCVRDDRRSRPASRD